MFFKKSSFFLVFFVFAAQSLLAVNPVLYRRCPSSNVQFFAEGDFLYWSPWMDPLEYTWKLTPVEPSDPSQRRTNQEFISLENSWDVGFRVSGGLELDVGWNCLVQWTHFHTKLQGSTIESSPILAPLYIQRVDDFPILNGGYRAEQAISSWKLDYDTLDLNFGREYYISPRLRQRPIIGMNFVWIDQRRIGQYNSVFTLNPVVFRGNQTGCIVDNAWGVGPKVGFKSSWVLASFFQLLGEVNLGFAFMNADQTTTRKVENDESKAIENYEEKLISKNQTEIWPNAQLGVGFDWNYCFRRSGFYLALQAKYELLYWWESSINDLSLQGLTLSGRLQF